MTVICICLILMLKESLTSCESGLFNLCPSFAQRSVKLEKTWIIFPFNILVNAAYYCYFKCRVYQRVFRTQQDLKKISETPVSLIKTDPP